MKDFISLLRIDRREFMQINALAGAGLLAIPRSGAAEETVELKPAALLEGLKTETGDTPLEGAVWYVAEKENAGMLYTFPKGALAEAACLSSDLLVDGNRLAVFNMTLQEGEAGPRFTLRYMNLTQVQSRIRFPLENVNMNRWRLEREGAWLKPICGGERVDLREVDRLTITILHKSDEPVRWCQTPLRVTKDEPSRLAKPLLTKGPLLDELGQSTLHVWPGKVSGPGELVKLLTAQKVAAAGKKWPDSFNRWGGWKDKKIEATGFFRTHHDGRRWWLADPEGCLFWSAGLDCVRPGIDSYCGDLENALTWMPDREGEYKAIHGNRSLDYLKANFIRAFGPEKWHDEWAAIALSQLREFGFNTVANWSEWQIARDARVPYVRPLSTRLRRSKMIYRDFPDVFHADFKRDAQEYGEQLRDTLDDPALIGYFLMNEPTWGFSREAPAAGMLFNTPACETRQELARFLGKKYGGSAALAKAWNIQATLEEIAEGPWSRRLTPEAVKDLTGFSAVMVTLFFSSLSEGCKAVDPNHLNLGIRYQGVPPDWMVEGMKSFDVFSMNCYQKRVPLDTCKKVHDLLNRPVVIGEFHFGALDVGLPAPGLVHVRTQADRGKAYRVYVEDAAANPYCVGTHYFTLYDQSAMGRFDGENYNIGFVDVCNQPYVPMTDAARMCHERLYALAAGQAQPYADEPEYLPRLF